MGTGSAELSELWQISSDPWSELFQCPFSHPCLLDMYACKVMSKITLLSLFVRGLPDDIAAYECRDWRMAWYGGAAQDKCNGSSKLFLINDNGIYLMMT